MYCKVCEKKITTSHDDDTCMGCRKVYVVDSIAQLFEQYPELEVYNDNCEAL